MGGPALWTRVTVKTGWQPHLGSFAEVGGQFKAADASSLVPYDDDGVNGVEFNVS